MTATTLDSHMDGEQPESVGSDIAGMASFLMDPGSAARRLFTKWFWIFPLVIFTLVSVMGSVLVTPIVRHVLETQPPPPNVNPETFARNVDFGMKLQQALSFVFPFVTILLQALVLWGMAAMLAVEAKFRQMLNLAAGASLISAIAGLAGVTILKAKGEISSMAELRPALGLDIFLPEGTNKFAMALVGYFSVFEIWWIVMVVLILSSAYRMSKTKALIMVAPLVILSLAFRLVGALGQRS